MSSTATVFADLHVHSSASDGVLSPGDLVRLGGQLGLKVIGLTDHDTLDGIEEARRTGEEVGVDLVSGIELSCGFPDLDYSLHILGLFVGGDAPGLRSMLLEQQKFRFTRALKILDLLEGLGFRMEPLRERFLADPGKVLGRPHVARYLLETGGIKSFQEAFEKFLAKGRPAYVPKKHLSAAQGIEAIRAAGGLAVIAHPGLIQDWQGIWGRLEGLPWDGIEAYYSEHSPEQVSFFETFAADHGFLLTGGSDYHGEYGKHSSRFGCFGLDREHFQILSEKAAARNREVNG